MTENLHNLLKELEVFAKENDSSVTERELRMRNITRDTGEFLAVLVHATKARQILEVGTSNGYSTLWLADAVSALGGKVTTIELSDFKVESAARNFARSGLASLISQIHAEAGITLSTLADKAYDLIFLDSEKPLYPRWWADIKRVLKPGGLLIVDNAISHSEQLTDFFPLVQSDDDFVSCLVPVGKGEFLATKSV